MSPRVVAPLTAAPSRDERLSGMKNTTATPTSVACTPDLSTQTQTATPIRTLAATRVIPKRLKAISTRRPGWRCYLGNLGLEWTVTPTRINRECLLDIGLVRPSDSSERRSFARGGFWTPPAPLGYAKDGVAVGRQTELNLSELAPRFTPKLGVPRDPNPISAGN